MWLTRVDLLAALESVEISVVWTVPLIILSTFLSMGIRFVRWHYLLRVNGFLVPTRDSLRIYLAGFAMVLTPAHVGEIFKSLLLRSRHGLPLKATVPVVVSERLFDLIAIMLIVSLSAGWNTSPLRGTLVTGVVAVALVASFGLVRWAGLAVVRSVSDLPDERAQDLWFVSAARVAVRAAAPRSAVVCLALSVASWQVAATAILLSLASTGIRIGFVDSSYVFAYGTALGAFSLLPAGVGVAGSTMILELGTADIPLEIASISILTVRVASVWLAIGIGIAMLVALTRRLTWPDLYFEPHHFDRIAPHYESQIAPHLRRHNLRKKIEPMLAALGSRRSLTGVDLGCGQGWYATELARRSGHRVLGLESSRIQLEKAMESNDETCLPSCFVVGDMLKLPLKSSSVDFAYSINAFHHTGSATDQGSALAEAARVLRPGGMFLLHEMNVSNPLLRFYLSYVFPVVRSIDEGTETWLDPRNLPSLPEMLLDRVQYFTFVPDFLPGPLLGPTRWLESRLESSRLRRYSVHYMAVYVRLPGEGDPEPAISGAASVQNT